MRFLTFCLVAAFLFPSVAKAQNTAEASAPKTMQQMEDTLLIVADSMYHATFAEQRLHYASDFVRLLVRALKTPGSYDYKFERLDDKINVLQAPDNAFRIFNWEIDPGGETRRYYGAVQLPGEELKLYGLSDITTSMTQRGLEDSVFKEGRWLGALYYRIIPQTLSDGQKVYTLFGMNSGKLVSNIKLLEVMRLTPEGPVFGAPIFGRGSETSPGQPIQRFILEYKKDAQVALNWSDELKAIYFDHLESTVDDPNRKYTYVPEGQIDGFRWQGDNWRFVNDLIPAQNLMDGQAPIGGR